MYELAILLAGAVCGGVLCYRWGRDDVRQAGHADGYARGLADKRTIAAADSDPTLGGGPREPA